MGGFGNGLISGLGYFHYFFLAGFFIKFYAEDTRIKQINNDLNIDQN